MCIVCDKIAFAIDTIEQLFPDDELITAFREAFLKEPGAEPRDNWGPKDLMACRANFICLVAIRYGIKYELNLEQLVQLFATLAGGETHIQYLSEFYKRQTGKDFKWDHHPVRPKGMDYDS